MHENAEIELIFERVASVVRFPVTRSNSLTFNVVGGHASPSWPLSRVYVRNRCHVETMKVCIEGGEGRKRRGEEKGIVCRANSPLHGYKRGNGSVVVLEN